MTDWEKLKEKIKEHVYNKRSSGRILRMRKELGIPASTMTNWINGNTIPNYNNGVAIERYLKHPVPDPVLKETHYMHLKRTNQLKL